MAKFEVCVESVEALGLCLAARVDSVEVCSALALGGLSPGAGLVGASRALADAGIAVHAMVRPRAGDFVWSAAEVAAMAREIGAVREAGLTGVVLGAGARSLDLEALAELARAGQGLVLTLHRVVDLLPDPVDAVADAIRLGFDRILTSGGARSAGEGAAVLERMARAAGGRLEIVAAAGLTPPTVTSLAARGLRSFHASCQAGHGVDPRLVELGFATASGRRIDAGRLGALLAAVRAIR
jgi:copper homeostasis protein